MFASQKYSYLFLRLGLAVVFLWFGVDKLIHLQYWITAWTPPKLLLIINGLNITQTQLIYGASALEIIVGLGLATSIFPKLFSFLAFLYLTVILIVNGLTEVTVRDIGLIGALLAVFFWPNFRSRY